MTGFFNKIFDFNRDGKIDMFERTTQYATFASIINDS